ncbi:LysR family transcriptional regulator [Salinicola rhizosphaerae]|uniref:LysR family transcriptional regulator n=1 Tax=Salinicola rhizosphaerae TaxID=1443141 RepID=A0ABQ3DV45_9GAMM|nr:LysR family transcriptional regulator [Salinicola rhizosphaerae]GHB14339.1 LysR family transcriptional regulator [Salinicola rhizosphaerae]
MSASLSTLRLFVDIVETGSLSAAARRHELALSSASHRLQQLEKELGATLLNRTTRTLSLTEEGAAYLQGCREALSAMNRAEDRLHRRQESLSGDIVVTAPNDVGQRLIAPAISAFCAEHPWVSAELHLSDAISRGVGRGIDLAVRTGPLQDSALVAVPLSQDRRRIVASPEYWREHPKPTHPKELADHNCMVLTRDGEPQTPWHFQDQGTALAVHVQGTLRANSGLVLRHWAMNGYGVILKSERDISAPLNDGRLESVLDEHLPTPSALYAVMARDRYRPQRLQALVDWLKAWCADHE